LEKNVESNRPSRSGEILHFLLQKWILRKTKNKFYFYFSFLFLIFISYRLSFMTQKIPFFSRYYFPNLAFSGTIPIGIITSFTSRIEHKSMHIEQFAVVAWKRGGGGINCEKKKHSIQIVVTTI
jgi:hypothetical protein